MKILFLTHRVPYPPDRGDRIRSYHLLKFLSARSQVSLGCLADEPADADAVGHLQRWTEKIFVAPLGRQARWPRAVTSLVRGRTATEGLFRSTELANVVRRWGREQQFDAVVAFCSSMVQYAEAPELGSVPLLVDLVDVDSQKWLDYAATAGRVRGGLYRLEARRLRRLEVAIADRASAVTLVSEPEADLYRSIVANRHTRAVPNGVDLDYFQPATSPHLPEQCVFVGALDYRANVEGLTWFCTQVWPLVLAKHPGAAFLMVGRRPAGVLRRMARAPGIRLVGEVPDVRPYLADAAVVVAPLQVARGIQNKVLEALAMAKAVVASPGAVEGLAVEPGRQLLRADAPESWGAAISRLLNDPAQRRVLGGAGRRFVEQHHSWDVCLQPFEDLLNLNGSEGLAEAASATQRRLQPCIPSQRSPGLG